MGDEGGQEGRDGVGYNLWKGGEQKEKENGGMEENNERLLVETPRIGKGRKGRKPKAGKVEATSTATEKTTRRLDDYWGNGEGKAVEGENATEAENRTETVERRDSDGKAEEENDEITFNMERIEEKETLGTKSHLKRTPVTRKERENENLVSEEQEKGALEETAQEPGGRKIGKGSKGREAREGSGEAGEGSGEAGEGSEYESTEERVSEADTNEEVWTQESMKSWLKKWEEKQKEEWEPRMSDLEGLMRMELKRVLSTELRYVLRKERVAETGTRNTEGREPGGEGWRCEDCERQRERRTEESGPRQGNFRQTWWKDWGESNYERVEQVGKEKDKAEFEMRKKHNEEQKRQGKEATKREF
ncbi:spore wall protein 2-like [Diachasma alloeum]|uniref:spore wall protein 2-like n=1 Tax=Diachasma alloeum TaxID=454923 RepID=UPI0007383134|nr:spore wall protein 2-like [Diachasma alloeum]